MAEHRESPEDVRRLRNGDLDQWRGSITALVEQHERRLSELNGDISAIRRDTGEMRESMATMKYTLRDQHDDVKDLSDSVKSAAKDKQQGLLDAVERARASTRNLVLGVLAPLAVAIVAGLIVYMLTGHPH